MSNLFDELARHYSRPYSIQSLGKDQIQALSDIFTKVVYFYDWGEGSEVENADDLA